MFLLPESLISSPDTLSQEDNECLEQHPELGFQVLSQLGSTYASLAQVVRQEHERWEGQGYPNKLKETEVHEHAQIIGIVDVFDALVSPRPSCQRMLPHEAVRELLVGQKNAFPHKLIKALVEQLSVFPIGTMVRLNTGEVGIVTQLNPRHPLRPIVRVSQSTDQTMRAASKPIDLSQTTQTHIVEVLKPVDVA
jgi:HD-GYP domain-containing protein (c-di-GMP phosphodiesterase class II)